jgi:hypothetical protein
MATNVAYGFVDEAADAGGVRVKALLGTPGVSDTLAARVTAADADGSGVLSLAELVSVFRSEEDAVKDKRMMRRCHLAHHSLEAHPHQYPAGCRHQIPRRCPQDRHRGRGAGVGAVRRPDGPYLYRGVSEQGLQGGRRRRDARQGQRRASVHRWGRGGVGGCCGIMPHDLDLNSHPGFAAIHLPGVDVCLLTPYAGQAIDTWDLSQLHRMAPDEAAQMATFTIDNGNSSTVYRVRGSADESPGRFCWMAAPTVCLSPATADYSSGALSPCSALPLCCKGTRAARGAAHHATVPPLIQVAAMTIDAGNKRASITSVGGAEFEVNDGGIFPVQVSLKGGRRLLQQRVRRPQRPARLAPPHAAPCSGGAAGHASGWRH